MNELYVAVVCVEENIDDALAAHTVGFMSQEGVYVCVCVRVSTGVYVCVYVCMYVCLCTVKPETLTNPHCNSIDEINFGELLDIFIEKALIWVY